MADTAKYMPINGGTTTLVTDFKSLFSFIKTRRTMAFFMFAFVGFTIFLAFAPSSNSSSPWLTKIFSTSSSTSATASADSYRSQISSLFDYFFSNSSSSSSSSSQQQGLNVSSSCSSFNSTRSNNTLSQLPNPKEELLFGKSPTRTQSLNKDKQVSSSNNTTFQSPNPNKNNTQTSVLHANQTTVSPPSVSKNPPAPSSQDEKKENSDKVQVLKANQTTILTGNAPLAASKSTSSPAKSDPSENVIVGKEEKIIAQKEVAANYTASLTKKQGNEKKQSNGRGSELPAKQGIENLVESLMNCDLFNGEWIKDNSYPLYKPGACSFIDEQFSCVANGRPDRDFQKMKWKPKGCTLPR